MPAAVWSRSWHPRDPLPTNGGCGCFEYCRYCDCRPKDLWEVLMTTSALEPVRPAATDVDLAAEALPLLRAYLTRHAKPEFVRVRVDDDATQVPLTVPRAAVELLATIMAHMAQGQAVSVVPSHAELTTQQAADLINVSRPYLIGLLEQGLIAYRHVGTHRRIRADSLMAYVREDNARRRHAADELTALGQDMDLI
jgi:excisionase family DNA binding protein